MNTLRNTIQPTIRIITHNNLGLSHKIRIKLYRGSGHVLFLDLGTGYQEHAKFGKIHAVELSFLLFCKYIILLQNIKGFTLTMSNVDYQSCNSTLVV